MKQLRRLNLGQRIVIVVALAGILKYVGDWLTSLGSFVTGWTGYAPLQIRPPGLTFGVRVLTWIGLVVVWGLLSVWVLHSDQQEPAKPSHAPRPLRRLRLLSLFQRIVIVIALAGVLWLFGDWVTTLGSPNGWVAYAPLSNAVNHPPGIPYGLRILIWIGLVMVWGIKSVWLLGSEPPENPDQ